MRTRWLESASAEVAPSAVVDFSVRRAAGGLFAAAGVQAAVCVAVTWSAYPSWFRFGVLPVVAAVFALGCARLVTDRTPSSWVARLCGLGAGFSVAASVGVAGVDTGGTNVAEPLVGLGVFGAGLASARTAAVVLIAAHRSGLALAGTGGLGEQLGLGLLEVASFTAAVVGGGRLRRWAATYDGPAAALAAAVRQDAEWERVDVARREHARLSHDEPLFTIRLIAEGVVVDSPGTRARCRREAAILRGRLPTVAEPDLTRDLAVKAEQVRGLGLEVVVDHEGVPVPLRADVTSAVVGATGAALRNVVRHGGVAVAGVRVTWSPGGVRVVITDRGRGFDSTRPGGFGVPEAIGRRMRQVGGTATVHSVPGRGTEVTVAWPG